MWLCIILLAVLHIMAAYRGPRWLFYVSKPLTVILMVIACLWSGVPSFYYRAIIVGLCLSVLGDIYLMLPQDRFIAGLISFFLAHVVYSVAFVSQWQGHVGWWLLALCIAVGVVVFLLLLPYLGKLQIPVALYMGVIILMAYTAGQFWLLSHSQAALLAMVGAVLFVLSDLTLAINRFKQEFTASTAIIMSTYFIAQGLFVGSVLAL
ncbi:lysoplasmalogenase [Photobacterium leiognathi]|uniref:lysoplasmalogenase n=1 Tax=Photobacterium leiognathi TaxID=553611 RepID=UPI00273851A9|nr:lysoplasmalogenase [Photobacterium leiognathi]